jgi:DNA-directed RNA polymerase subunit RPC12/RpoP
MYKCNDCGETFAEPVEYTDYTEFWGAVAANKEYCCPYCDGYDWKEEFI